MTSTPTTASAATSDETGTTGPTAFSPAGNFVRAALITYLTPRLFLSCRSDCVAIVNVAVAGLTSRNFQARRRALIDQLKRLTQGKLDYGADIADLPALLAALAPEIERADQTTLTVIDGGASRQAPTLDREPPPPFAA